MRFPGVLFACDVAGCTNKTFHDKPYCPGHDHLYPQVQLLRKRIQERHDELDAIRAAIRNRLEGGEPPWKSIPSSSQILHELQTKLEAVEIRTLRDISQAMDLTCEVTAEYLQALEAMGVIRIKRAVGSRVFAVALLTEVA